MANPEAQAQPAGAGAPALELNEFDALLQKEFKVQKDAAKLLGVTRRKLNYMIARMGLTHPTWRRHRGGETRDPVLRGLP